MKRISQVLVFCTGFLLLNQALALTFPLPFNGDDVVGEAQVVFAQPGDDFNKIAQRYDIGFYELVEANPDVDPSFILVGQRILIPTIFILPNVPRRGLVINLDELRLYYYPPEQNVVVSCESPPPL